MTLPDALVPWSMMGLAVIATFVWRMLGLALADRLASHKLLFDWVNTVAYAMVAGLMVRIIFFPTNVTAEAPMIDRLAAFAAALLVWWLRGRSQIQGFAAGVAVFALLSAARLYGFLP
ncbi:AzlD domain-containing protein [Hwanghaeella grinnelliae]|uniref:AzlD domain-containing protein n=1 Tax=Hwanghaeella grinnelliae TaxID=2500179 RepID=A0A3S2W516_9PROT|nr:AzlD domain-containing protein [Hwanghaeella grinnelliae]RVU36658.1 AzlD domain-containing protein [Hwanghaeella grinnelliae]